MVAGPLRRIDPLHRGHDRRAVLAGVAAAAFSPLMARAAEPGRSDADMVTDWPWLGRYASDNAKVLSAGAKVQIVFIGDSITEFWQHRRPDFFGSGRINRGISGQTSPQILLRMMPDVIALRPRFVHILAGTNDAARNTGLIASDDTVANIIAMAQLAKANGVRPVIGTIPPAAQFPWRPQIEAKSAIAEINQKLRRAALAERFRLVDYHAALSAADGSLPRELGEDGVHPGAAGYERMEQALIRAVPAFGHAP